MVNALNVMDALPDGWGLVGLNDQVHKDGALATHWLADKRLLPLLDGEFFHTGYKHLFCDNELTDRCKRMNRFVWAEDAVIEHDHPVIKGELLSDDYKKIYSSSNVLSDMRLYHERKKIFNPLPKMPKVIMGMPLPKDRKTDLKTAEFCFREFSGRKDWHWQTQTDESVADARNAIALKMLDDNYTHLFFLDADTVPPLGTVDKLLAADKDIIAGVTPTWNYEKRWNFRIKQNEPVLFGPLQNELMNVKWVGGTTVLIKRKVFEALDWPYYESFKHPCSNGITHDYYFCEKALKAGFEIWVDPTIVCGHWNTVDLLDIF